MSSGHVLGDISLFYWRFLCGIFINKGCSCIAHYFNEEIIYFGLSLFVFFLGAVSFSRAQTSFVGPSLSVELDVSTPPAASIPAGSVTVPVTVLRVQAKNGGIALRSLGLQFDGANPYLLKRFTLWDGTTQVGSGRVFGKSKEAIIFFSPAVLVPNGGIKLLTIKVDLAPPSSRLQLGDTFAINYNGDRLWHTVGLAQNQSSTVTSETKTDTNAAKMNIVTPVTLGPLLPDLVIESLAHSPASGNVSSTIALIVKILNKGNEVAATSSLQIRVGNESQGTIFVVPTLAAFEGFTVRREFLALTPGIHAVNAAIDIQNSVPELNENNNYAGDLFSIHSSLLPDLVAKEISGVPSGVAVTVCNYGGLLTKSVTVDLALNSLTRRITLAKGDIPTGSCSTRTEHYSRFQLVQGQLYVATVSVDPDNKVSEENESNNSLSGTIVGPTTATTVTETSPPLTALDYNTAIELASIFDSLSSIIDTIIQTLKLTE